MGLCYPQNVCVPEGRRDRLERGPEEVLRRHSKPDTSLGPAGSGLSPQNMGVLTGGPGIFLCLLCWRVYGREGAISPLHLVPPHSHPNKTTSSFLAGPPQSHQTLLSSLSSPINLSRQETSPSPPAQSSRSNIQEAGTQRDSTAILAKASLGVRAPPLGQWGGRGRQLPGPGAGSEVHAPGGLTDARVRRSREGGNRNRCLEGNRFFVLLLLLVFFCLWIVKSCSGGRPPGQGCTRTRRSPGCQGPAG